MRARASILVAVFLMAAPVFGQTPQVQKGFLKRSVAGFAEPDRSTYVGFLNAARTVSDAAAKALGAGNANALAKNASPEAVAQAREVIGALKGSTLQYRNQALELVGAAEVPTSRVWYVVVTGSKPTANFVAIIVEQPRTGRAGRVIGIEPLSYAGAIPPWLQRVDAGVGPKKK